MDSYQKEVQRTTAQNRALHLFFQQTADALNDAGLDMRVVLKPEVAIPWTAMSIKESLWRPVQNLQLGKRSTTELGTKDIDVIYDTINRHLSEKFGLHIAFPSIESLVDREKT